jgi:predicted RNA binding protein YcfA (HicA-like mRNA interferase family)
MKPRKTKDLLSTLLKKGFAENSSKKDHKFLYLIVDGKKANVYTYLSHGSKEYSPNLMAQIKKQLKFENIEQAENFFDCPMSKEEYISILKKKGVL